MSHKEWRLKALTDIWTGDAEQKGDRLIPTGLLGSLRWWFEVLVRGLDGKACDPTSPVRCPDNKKNPTEPSHHCVVCELFGCTGWARKFRLMVLNAQGDVSQSQIQANTAFTLRLVPIRPISHEEWCLLDLTLRLIADYGAIGGKTVLKPSDETNRQNATHHKEYGLIHCTSGPDHWKCEKSCEELKNYVAQPRWRAAPHNNHEGNRVRDFSWASLQNFWCVRGQGRYLARHDRNHSTFNCVIGRSEPKGQAQNGDSWLAGRRARTNVEPESKKVFSFKHPQEGGRTFGFINPGTVSFDEMKPRLKRAWSDLKDTEFLTGEKILKNLCEEAHP